MFSTTPAPHPSKPDTTILATVMFLLPAVGVASQLLVQDTLKSAMLACAVLLAALRFVARQWPPQRALQWHAMLWLPLMLLIYALCSMFWSHTYMAGADAARWLILGLLIWLGMNTITHTNIRGLLLGIYAGAVLGALWAAAQFWGGLALFPQGPAPASTFYNRNFYAEYAVCALPFSVWWLCTLRSPRWLFAVALSIALQITTIFMTGTRSALLALLVLLPLLCTVVIRMRQHLPWPHGALRKRIVLVLLLGLVILGNLPTGNPGILKETPNATPWRRSLERAQTLAQAETFHTGSLSIRTQMWLATARMVQDHPWRGVGAGAWEINIPRYQRDDSTLELDYYAHNEYLQLLSEYGLPTGGLALAWLLAYWIHSAISTFRLRDNTAGELPARAFSLLSLLALAVVSCAGFPWHLAGTTALMGLSIALLCASDLRLTSPAYARVQAPAPTPRLRRYALGALIAILAATLYVCQRAFRAEQKILTGVLLTDQLPRKAIALTEAQQATKNTLLTALREGVALHPYYRKLTAQAAEVMMEEEDWRNAAWILQSVADSHPYVSAIWNGLALSYAHLRQPTQALNALQHLKQLRPLAKSTQNLEIVVLSTSGQDARARELMDGYFSRLEMDYEMTMTGYALGIKLQDQALALRALTLRQQYWPESAADSYFRMGNIYRDMAPRSDTKALQAFALGLQNVPANERRQYIQQVPAPLRAQLGAP